jgi:hypothetical protein
MKHWILLGLAGALLMHSRMHGFGEHTMFIPRSISVDAARDLCIWQRDINQYEAGDWYWTTNVTFEYDRTFDGDAISNYLFGASCLTFSGSRSPNRAKTDILADYFGLPADFNSTVSFCPRISTFVADFSSFVGLDRIWQGLYVRWHTPIVHTKWSLGMCENITNPGAPFDPSEGQGFHPAGYMGPDRIVRSQLATNVTQAWCYPVTYGDMQSPLCYGRVCPCPVSKSEFSDTEGAIGWNFLQKDWYHAGFNIRGTLPWSERPSQRLLFQPQIGNNHHWEIGMGWTSHVDVWQSADELQRFAVYLDANLMHLCSSTQLRSYDLTRNGPGSRYMLLEQLTAPSTVASSDLADESGTPYVVCPLQYARNLVPAINVTTLCSQISVNAEFDLALKASYFNCGWGVDIGYNLWARSAETLECRAHINPEVTWAVKGDAQVYGFASSIVANQPVPAAATESLATIRGGPGGSSNFALFAPLPNIVPAPATGFINTDIDNPGPRSQGFIYDSAGAIHSVTLNQLNTLDATQLSIQQRPIIMGTPINITDADINEASALAPRFVSHKFFVTIDYRWQECEKATPFFGVGAATEWARTCKISNCAPEGYAQWGVWAKGGFSY